MNQAKRSEVTWVSTQNAATGVVDHGYSFRALSHLVDQKAATQSAQTLLRAFNEALQASGLQGVSESTYSAHLAKLRYAGAVVKLAADNLKAGVPLSDADLKTIWERSDVREAIKSAQLTSEGPGVLRLFLDVSWPPLNKRSAAAASGKLKDDSGNPPSASVPFFNAPPPPPNPKRFRTAAPASEPVVIDDDDVVDARQGTGDSQVLAALVVNLNEVVQRLKASVNSLSTRFTRLEGAVAELRALVAEGMAEDQEGDSS